MGQKSESEDVELEHGLQIRMQCVRKGIGSRRSISLFVSSGFPTWSKRDKIAFGGSAFFPQITIRDDAYPIVQLGVVMEGLRRFT